MNAADDRNESVVDAVSDGNHVDWEAEERLAPDERARDVLRELRVVETIAKAHRAPHAQTATLTSTPGDGPGQPQTTTAVAEREGGPHPRVWCGLKILEKIGEGSYGEVFRAHDTKLEREVALKLYRTRTSRVGQGSASSLREGRLLARVRHPNVVTVYGAEESGGRVGIWMELVRGRTLEVILDEHGPFGPREAGLVGIDLCRSLGALHRAGLVHRDVKAQNVIRESGGRIVLMDLGLGQEWQKPPEPGNAWSVAGTPLYMTPEILSGAEASPESDLYAVGVLLFHLVTGEYPVQARTLRDLLAAHSSGNRKLLRDLRQDLPEPFVAVVERALASAAEERFASAGAMESALATALGSRAEATERSERVGWKRKWVGISLAALALAAVIGLGVFQLIPGKTGSFVRHADLFRMGAVVGEPLTTGDSVRPGDRVFLEIEGREPLHVYVLNRDHSGEFRVLFPVPEAEAGNPLPGGIVERLPGKLAGTGKPASWQIDEAGTEETFLVLASRAPLVELEREIEQLARQELRSRGAATVEMDAPDSATTAGRLGAVLRDLAAAERGVWVREIVLRKEGASG